MTFIVFICILLWRFTQCTTIAFQRGLSSGNAGSSSETPPTPEISPVHAVVIGHASDPLQPYRSFYKMASIGQRDFLFIEKVERDIIFHPIVIAKGAFGKIYKGFDRTSNAVLAIKSMYLFGTVHILQAANEVLILKKIPHPNIVQFHSFDIICSGSQMLLGMEYLEWNLLDLDLNNRIFMAEDNLGTIAYVAKEVLTGIDWLHKNGVAHRDIKPQNIMVGRDGSVKLIDFGGAKILEYHGQKFEKDFGTLLYAPLIDTIDEKSDIYSFGLSLLHVLSIGIVHFDLERIPLHYNTYYLLDVMKHERSNELYNFLRLLTQADRPPAEVLLDHSFLRKAVSKAEFAAKLE